MPSKTSRVTSRPGTLDSGEGLAADPGGQGRDHVEEVGDDAVVGDREDGCPGIRVHGDDELRAAHPLEMLRGPADPERPVDPRLHLQPGLADLPRPWQPAEVGDRARRRDGPAERGREGLHVLEVLLLPDPPAPRDEDGFAVDLYFP